jgi:hypothetical protein
METVVAFSSSPGIAQEDGSGPALLSWGSAAIMELVGVEVLGGEDVTGSGSSGCGLGAAVEFTGLDGILGGSISLARCRSSLNGVLTRGIELRLGGWGSGGTGSGLTGEGSAWTTVGSVGHEEGENVKDIGALDVNGILNVKGVGLFVLLLGGRVGV